MAGGLTGARVGSTPAASTALSDHEEREWILITTGCVLRDHSPVLPPPMRSPMRRVCCGPLSPPEAFALVGTDTKLSSRLGAVEPFAAIVANWPCHKADISHVLKWTVFAVCETTPPRPHAKVCPAPRGWGFLVGTLVAFRDRGATVCDHLLPVGGRQQGSGASQPVGGRERTIRSRGSVPLEVPDRPSHNPSRSLISSAPSVEVDSASPPTTASNRRSLRALRSITFSSMVPLATRR